MNDTEIRKLEEETRREWEKVKNKKGLSLEEKIRRIIKIPIQDVKNILSLE